MELGLYCAAPYLLHIEYSVECEIADYVLLILVIYVLVYYPSISFNLVNYA